MALGFRDELRGVPLAEDHGGAPDQDRGLVPDHQSHGVEHGGHHADDVLSRDLVFAGGAGRRDEARRVTDHRPLRAAGGAAGERHGDGRRRVDVPVRSGVGLGRDRLAEFERSVERSVEGWTSGDDQRRDCRQSVVAQPIPDGGIHHQHPRAGALQDVGNLGRRVERRNVHEHAAGPGVSEMDNAVFRAVEQQARDPVAGAYPRRDQQVREAVRQPVVLPEVEPPVAGDDRGLPRRPPGGEPQDFAERQETVAGLRRLPRSGLPEAGTCAPWARRCSPPPSRRRCRPGCR